MATKLNYADYKEKWRKLESKQIKIPDDPASFAKDHGVANYYKTLLKASEGDVKAFAQFNSLPPSWMERPVKGIPSISGCFFMSQAMRLLPSCLPVSLRKFEKSTRSFLPFRAEPTRFRTQSRTSNDIFRRPTRSFMAKVKSGEREMKNHLLIASMCISLTSIMHAESFGSFEQALVAAEKATTLSIKNYDPAIKHLPSQLGTLINLAVFFPRPPFLSKASMTNSTANEETPK